jgi:hypothetical protein
METMSPSNCELYVQGHIEVPACGPCGASEPCACNAPGITCNTNGFGPCGGPGYGEGAVISNGHPGGPMATPQEPETAPVEIINPGELNGAADPIAPQGAARPMPGPAIVPATAPGPDPSAGMRTPGWHTAADPTIRHNPTPILAPANRTTSTPGLIGPIGYDVQK